jgi:hypothetical protein
MSPLCAEVDTQTAQNYEFPEDDQELGPKHVEAVISQPNIV